MQRGGVAPRVAAQQPVTVPASALSRPEQDAQRGGLPGAVGPEEPVHLAGGDRQVESVEGAYRSERLDQAGDGDGVSHGINPTTLTEGIATSGAAAGEATPG